MNLQEVQGRLRELFPKANLSKTRIEQYATKLTAKLNEESTQEDLDNLIKDLNDVVNFEEVAKQDDQLRTFLNAKPKTKEEEEPKPKEDIVDDSTPAWAKALQDEIKSLRAEKVTETIETKFRGHESLKGVPKEMLDLVKTPQTLEEVDTFANQIAEIYKDKQIKDKLNSFGADIPTEGKTGKTLEVKQASDAEIDEVFKNIAK